jgi:hypothetical protein
MSFFIEFINTNKKILKIMLHAYETIQGKSLNIIKLNL